MENADAAGVRTATGPTATARQMDMTCLERLVTFVEENGRMPSGADAPADESVLNRWLSCQQAAAAAGSMSSGRRAVLDAALPGWMPPAEAVWLDRARECADFVSALRRDPETDAGEPERSLAIWLRTQLAVDAAGALPPEMASWLRDHLPGWAHLTTPHPRRASAE